MQEGAATRTHQVCDLYDKAIAHAEGGVRRPDIGTLLIRHTHSGE